MKRFALLCAMLWFYVAFAAPVRAAPLTVVLPEVIPHAFLAPDGRQMGIYLDVLNAVAKESGIALRYQIVPFARVVRMLNDGETDLALVNRDAVNPAQASALGAIYQLDLVLWPARGARWQSLSELAGKDVGRLRGGCQPLLQKTQPKFNEVNNFDQGVRMLDVGRLDALCGSRDVILYAIWRSGLPGLATLTPLPLTTTPVVLMANPKVNSALQQRLATAVAKVMAGPTLLQAKARFGLH